MDLNQLFHVMDVILNEIRGNLHSIQTMHGFLNHSYKSGSFSIGTRAGIDSFFEFLMDEALTKMGGKEGVVKPPEESKLPPSVSVASELTWVGREDNRESEAMFRKRNRNADTSRSSMHAPLANSTANRFQMTTIPDEKIDLEKYMSEPPNEEKVEEEEPTDSGACRCSLHVKQTFTAMPESAFLTRGTPGLC